MKMRLKQKKIGRESFMKKCIFILLASLIMTSLFAMGCDGRGNIEVMKNKETSGREAFSAQARVEQATAIEPTSQIVKMEEAFSAVRRDGDYGFDAFLAQGGASSDADVMSFLTENLVAGVDMGFLGELFGCSTLSTKSGGGEHLFGRNFDWENCEAMVVVSSPEKGYQSISTVNMDFITQRAGSGIVGIALQMDEIKTLAALYAPLDGMNEQGLAVAVNMIADSATIDQNTDKPDLTTTTAVRLLLNKAADVDEAIALLAQYDLHASMGMMVHFALADANGKSVVVEYVNNEMVVTQTPVVTNFYLAEGEKKGIGSAQSHRRYDILMEKLADSDTMEKEEVRDALDSVSKDNFGEFESTEWSIVFDQTNKEARYYHRENYEKSYLFTLV